MIKIHKKDESNYFIECDFDDASMISEWFTFMAPNYFFNPRYKAGFWDGKIRLFNIRDCLLPQGLLSKLLSYFKQLDIEYELMFEEKPGKKISSSSIEKFCKKLQTPFQPRDYQISAVQHILYNKKMIVQSATSSGKSMIAFLAFNLMKYVNDKYKFLLVVPNINLVDQMANDFCEYGEKYDDYNKYIQRIHSEIKQSPEEDKKPIVISTWQSLQNKSAKYFEQFNFVMVDECHTANAKQLSDIVSKCSNAEYKIGMSGTLKDSKVDILQLNGLFGRVKVFSNTRSLMDQGHVAKLKIKGIVLNYPKEDCTNVKNLVALKSTESEKAKNASSGYKEEMNYINQHKVKIGYVCKLAETRDNNTLILFKSLKYGKKLYDHLKKISKKQVFYIDGDVNSKEREEAKKYCEKNNDCIIIASYGTFSTGISIKNLHYLIFGETLKSPIKVIQSVGRLLRLHKDKEFATLFDIADNLSAGKKKNYALKHFLDRISYYEKENLNYTVKNIDI